MVKYLQLKINYNNIFGQIHKIEFVQNLHIIERSEITMVEYRDIKGYEGWYQITNEGEVWGLKSNKFLQKQLRGDEGKQYYYVGLCKNGVKNSYRVNRLVAEAFIDNPLNLPVVNHKDGNKLNNNADNLEWCDYKYNNDYDNRKEKAVESRKNNGNCRKTIMCDKTTHDTIKEFVSTSEAIEYLQLPKHAASNISATIKGRKKSAYGYFWKTED